MGTEIRLINILDHAESCLDLMKRNWAETGFDFEFRPDFQRYATMQRAGVLFALAAFHGEDIVGYCTVAVTPHPYNPTVTMAASDALFVAPEHRVTLPARLIRSVEQAALDAGASRMLWHCRAGTTLASIFEKRGYEPVDQVVMRIF